MKGLQNKVDHLLEEICKENKEKDSAQLELNKKTKINEELAKITEEKTK